jgi:hypothetical protein
MQNEVFEQLQQVRNELERSRKEASDGRQKAERDLHEASRMVLLLLLAKFLLFYVLVLVA